MSDIVIKVENIWKEYHLGVVSHHSMAKDLQSWWARVRGKEDPNAPVGTTGQSLKPLKSLKPLNASTGSQSSTSCSSQTSPVRRFTDSPIQSSSPSSPDTPIRRFADSVFFPLFS